MKLKFLKPAALAALALVGFSACEDSTFIEGNAIERVSYLYLDYWNPYIYDPESTVPDIYGNSPMIELDEENTSKDVIIDFEKTFTGRISGSNTAEIVIDNVRIYDEYGNYKIKAVSVDEEREGLWAPQSQNENPVTVSDLEELDVAIVFDNSEYLANQFDNMKSNAISFIRNIGNRVKNSKFTVVTSAGGFDKITASDFGSAETAISAINNMQKDSYSYLCSACQTAMDILKTGTSSSKVMVYFGSGNYSQTDTVTKTAIVERLNSDKYRNIQTFALAYSDNGVVSSDMKALVNSFCVRGYAVYPTEGEKLGDFFDYFSNSLASAYHLTYRHEATKFDENNKQKIRFKLLVEQQR